MGPKGKSKALFQQQKSREIANLAMAKNKMDDKISTLKANLDVLNDECQNLSFVIQTKNCELSGLREEISDLSVSVTEHQNTKVQLKNSLVSLKDEIIFLNRDIQNQRLKILRKKKILMNGDKFKTLSSTSPFRIASLSVTKRKRHPYSYESRSKVLRCKEVLEANSLILGGSDTNKQPVLDGMLDTISRKFPISDVLKTISISKEKKVQQLNKGFASLYNMSYYLSNENKFRSLSTYYAHDVLGKRKYLAIRKANRKSIFRAERVPNYIPYSDLSTYINSIDIGPLQPLYSGGQDKVKGMYRDLRLFVPRLASFYLRVNEHRSVKLLTFDKFPRKDPSSFLFLISFGGDGAPGIGTIFNISFLNAGKRIMSSSETFTVLGGDFNETDKVIENYVSNITQDFSYLEENVFPIKINDSTIKNVEFKFVEFPNDMKFLCFLAGELTNSATYFTTFANVSTDYMDVRKSFGVDWKPWSYDKRIKDSTAVAKFKKQLKPGLAESTARNKITPYIASLNSRQEFVPLLKKYIDFAKCEPLHLKNNVCQDYFKIYLIQICGLKPIKEKLFKNLPSDDVFRVFVLFVKGTMKLNLLSIKLISWFNDTKRSSQDFKFRFRGEESFGFLTHFPTLFKFFLPFFEAINGKSVFFMRLFRQLLCVRKLISYTVRLNNFNQEDLDNMFSVSNKLIKYLCHDTKTITPSLWVLCHISPTHAEKTYKLYDLGLGVNSMEPREQKHQRIKKYAENTTYQDKWKMIFRHEFIQLIYLRENGYDEKNYNRKGKTYVPIPSPGSCSRCGLLLDTDFCILCTHIFTTESI